MWLGLRDDWWHLFKFRHKSYTVRFRKWLLTLGFKWEVNSSLLGESCFVWPSTSDTVGSCCLCKIHHTMSSVQVFRKLMQTALDYIKPCASLGHTKGYIPCVSGWHVRGCKKKKTHQHLMSWGWEHVDKWLGECPAFVGASSLLLLLGHLTEFSKEMFLGPSVFCFVFASQTGKQV